MSWTTDEHGVSHMKVGHLELRTWVNGRAYWEVRVGAHVLGTGYTSEAGFVKQDALDCANRLALVVLAAVKKASGTEGE